MKTYYVKLKTNEIYPLTQEQYNTLLGLIQSKNMDMSVNVSLANFDLEECEKVLIFIRQIDTLFTPERWEKIKETDTALKFIMPSYKKYLFDNTQGTIHQLPRKELYLTRERINELREYVSLPEETLNKLLPPLTIEKAILQIVGGKV